MLKLRRLSRIIKKVYRRIKGKPYVSCLKGELTGYRSILDLGCGKSSPIKSFSKIFYYSVGTEMFKPYLLKTKETRIHDDYVLADVRKLGFRPRSFDTVVALDLIEHLTKGEACHLIETMEEIARKNVVVFTPNGFLCQSEYDRNIYQVHRSGWTVKEFRNMGYEVKGINGLKFLRKEEAYTRFRPRRLFQIISDISQKLTYNFPNLAFQLLCVKELPGNKQSMKSLLATSKETTEMEPT